MVKGRVPLVRSDTRHPYIEYPVQILSPPIMVFAYYLVVPSIYIHQFESMA